MAGVYIHIPFCSQFCIYCDFYSTKQYRKIGDYLQSLYGEIDTRRGELTEIGSTVETIYFGGGTPSLLAAGLLAGILQKIFSNYPLSAGGVAEVTVEANPDDLTQPYLRELREAGFNRLSLGIQSFDDHHLKWMNRRHDALMAVNAFRMAREAGFGNISVDLIFGYEALTMDRWQQDIESLLRMEPEHISAYQMSVEPGTPLHKLATIHTYANLSDEDALRQYLFLQNALSTAGFNQYEVSNFSKPGKESCHNSAYWNGEPYIGLGPAAHSFDGKRRSWNSPSLRRYISSAGREPRKGEFLSPKDRFNEFLMLSLRRVSGIDKTKLDTFPAEFLSLNFCHTLTALKEKGLLEEEDNFIRIPPDKLFISDGIIRELFLA